MALMGGMLFAQVPAGTLEPSNGSAKPSTVAAAEPNGMSKELGEAILAELRQIRVLLEKPAAAQPAPVVETGKVSATGFSIGRADAPLTLVEFADYQCPFCRQFNTTVYEKLKKNYIDTGKLRFVSRTCRWKFIRTLPQLRNAAAALATRTYSGPCVKP